jgi:hypothetical protein
VSNASWRPLPLLGCSWQLLRLLCAFRAKQVRGFCAPYAASLAYHYATSCPIPWAFILYNYTHTHEQPMPCMQLAQPRVMLLWIELTAPGTNAHRCAGPTSKDRPIPQQYIALIYDTISDVEGVAQGVAKGPDNVKILHKYNNAIKGFSFRLPTAVTPKAQEKILEAMKNRFSHEIESITPDYPVKANGTAGMQLSAWASDKHTSYQPSTRK